MSLQDRQLVEQVLAGNQTAYEILVNAYKGRVFALVVGRIGQFSAAEDVVQNTFVEVYVHLKSLKSPEKFSGWLRGIAVNLSNRWLQNQRPTVSLDHSSGEMVPEGNVVLPEVPDQIFEAQEMKTTVFNAVEALPEIYREAVLLHYMEGMTYPEIAAFLEVPESTVTGRLQVARNRLRDELMPLVEDALEEKRPTSSLTRKIMSALPPLLYVATPSQASWLMTLKGSNMIKMIGFLSAGIVGTGLYFGGISEMMNWKGNAEQSISEGIAIELVQEVKTDQDVLAENGALATEAKLAQKGGVDQNNQVDSGKTKPVSDGNGGTGKPEKADFKMESSPQDSVVKIIYWLPASVYPDSAFVEIAFFNIMGAQVAKPVDRTHKPGTYTAYLSKRGISDGQYFAWLMFNHDKEKRVLRGLNLIWEDRK